MHHPSPPPPILAKVDHLKQTAGTLTTQQSIVWHHALAARLAERDDRYQIKCSCVERWSSCKSIKMLESPASFLGENRHQRWVNSSELINKYMQSGGSYQAATDDRWCLIHAIRRFLQWFKRLLGQFQRAAESNQPLNGCRRWFASFDVSGGGD